MSQQLSPRQIRLLKKVSFIPGVLSEHGDSDRNIYRDLDEMGLVDASSGLITITEKGKAVLSSNRFDRFTKLAPILISLASLFMSIIALLRT